MLISSEHHRHVCHECAEICTECAEALDDACPNCGGELMDRPTRAKQLHEKFPPATKRKFAG